jgi:hypothetical protein
MNPSDLMNHPLLASLPITPIQLAMASSVFLVVLLLLVWTSIGRRRRKSSAKAMASRAPQQVLDARFLAAPQTSPEGLQGGLKHMPMPDLLQFLAQGRRTGTLELTSGRRGGLIRLVQGMVVHAEYRRTEDLDAMFGLLTMETGDFVFTPTTPPDYQVSGREVVDILMLWLSRKDGQP